VFIPVSWSITFPGLRRRLGQPPAAEHSAAGKGCGEPGSYHTIKLDMVIRCENKSQSVSRPRERIGASLV